MALTADATMGHPEVIPQKRDAAADRQPETAAWQEAQDRLLCYLKALSVPPLESLELAKLILDRLHRERANGAETRPVQEAMRMLHRVLAARSSTERPFPALVTSGDAQTAGPGRCRTNEALGAPPVFQSLLSPYCQVQVAPEIMRGSMPASPLPRWQQRAGRSAGTGAAQD